MSQPGHVIAIDLHEPETLDEDIAVCYGKCEAKLGLVPNVLPSVWLPWAARPMRVTL